MTNAIRGLLVLFACAVLGGLVMAGPEPNEQVVSGTVVSAGNLLLVIDADDGRRMTFVLDNATLVPTGLPPVGVSVVVRYSELDSERSQALSVTRFDPVDAVAPRADVPNTSSGDDPVLAVIASLEPAWGIVLLACLAALFLLMATLRLLRNA